MEILPGFTADGCALYLANHKSLVLSDLHIGKEEELRASGMLVPLSQKEFYREELTRLLRTYDVEQVVLNGDIKHEFSRISSQEWSEVQSFVQFVRGFDVVVEVVLGNHDNMLLPILAKLGIEGKTDLLLGDILVTHGDRTYSELLYGKEAKTIVAGHEHPSMTIADGVRSESVKCFLVGTIEKKTCVVMPAFNPLSLGADVLRARPQGPLLASYNGFSAFAVIGDEVLAFGLIENIQRHQR